MNKKASIADVVCVSLFSNFLGDALSAARFFGEKRTYNGEGMHVPSQYRYLQYFQQ